jgi:hypothetical protein
MRALNTPDAFNSDDMFPIDRHERSQARIDRGMIDLLSRRIILGYDNCAGPAATFCATQLGSGQTDASEIFQQGDFGVGRVQDNLGPVQKESKCIVVVTRHGSQCTSEAAVNSWRRVHYAWRHRCKCSLWIERFDGRSGGSVSEFGVKSNVRLQSACFAQAKQPNGYSREA